MRGAQRGLLLDPYFSGTKIMWALENVPGIRDRAQAGGVCFGTVDSWLVHMLTGRHATDPSNASRTLLFDIRRGRCGTRRSSPPWGFPLPCFPEVTPSASDFCVTSGSLFGTEIPVRGVPGRPAGGAPRPSCLEPGMVKVTYGTGCFCLLCTGRDPVISHNRLLTTVAWDIGDGLEYALEGAVFIGGAVVQWLRDELRILSLRPLNPRSSRARTVRDTGGVYFGACLPWAWAAPSWDPDARGAMFGITRGTRQEQVVRAALESIAYQTRDLVDAYGRPSAGRSLSVRSASTAARR